MACSVRCIFLTIQHCCVLQGNEKQKGAMNSSAKGSKVKKDDSDDDFEVGSCPDALAVVIFA
jgi:hypothetical protein